MPKQMDIIYRQIKDLKPYNKNAKKHSKQQIEQIANSIIEFGFTQPVLIDNDNNVVAGHGRILGAKKAGYKTVPTVKLSTLTPKQIQAYRLIDNKLNESPWDDIMLDEELEDLFQELDMSLFGFDKMLDDDEIEEELGKEVKFTVKEKHQVIVDCDTEEETIKVQSMLERQGYSCTLKNT